MKAMTVGGSTIDASDNPVLIINNTEVLRFVGAWPTSLSRLTFDATAQDAQYITSTLTLNYDYLDYIGQFKTVDSKY
jgi:hypothetical protein